MFFIHPSLYSLKKLTLILIVTIALLMILFLISNNNVQGSYNRAIELIPSRGHNKKICTPKTYAWNDPVALQYLNESNIALASEFSACPLYGPKVNQLEDLMEFKDMSKGLNEHYTISIKTELARRSFNLSSNEMSCSIQRFDKIYNVRENNDLEFEELLKFHRNKSNVISVTFYESGFYNIECMNNRTQLFNYVLTVLPKVMTKLKNKSRKDNREKVNKLIAPFKDLPQLKDTEFKICTNNFLKLNDSKKMNEFSKTIELIESVN